MLKLKKIFIKNFMGISEQTFEIYDNGLYMIVGPNGSGKSTRLEALIWCIFGKTVRGNLTNSDIINEKAGRNCLVEVYFEYMNNSWFIRRTIKHDELKNSLMIFKDNVDYTRKSISETEDLISEIFGDYDMFVSTIFFPQQFSNTFLDMSDKEQKDLFEKILNFNEIRNNCESCKKKMEKTSEEKEGCEQSIKDTKIIYDMTLSKYDALLNQVENEIKNQEEIKDNSNSFLKTFDINGIKEKILKIEKELEETQNSKNNSDNKIFNIEEDFKNKKNRINNKALNIKRMIDNRKSKLSNELISVQNNLNSKINDEISSSSKDKYDDIDKISKDIELISKNINNRKIEETKFISDFEKENNKETVRIQMEEIYPKDKEFNNNDMRIFEINKKIKEYEVLKSKKNSKCPVCQRKMDDGARECLDECISEFNKELKNLEKQNKLLLKEVKELNEKILKLNENKEKEIFKIKTKFYNDAEKDKNKYNELNNSRVEIKKNLENIKENINKKYEKILKDKEIEISNRRNLFEIRIENTRKIYKTKLELIDSEKENILKNHKKISNTLSEKIELLKDELKTLNIKKEEYVAVETKLKNSLSSIDKLKNDISKIKNEKSEEILKITNRIVELGKNLEKMETDSSYYKFWLEAFSRQGIENLIIGRSIPFLNSRLQYYLTKLNCGFNVMLQNTDYTQKGEERNKLSCKIYRDGDKNKETKFVKLSGGEKRIIDIAMMFSLYDLALSRSNLISNVIFFDEVFDNLDDDNGTNAVKLMKDFSEEKSCYLITHNTFWKSQDYDEIIDVD
ncbi:SMC family ATPase [bacterium]|jgi:DNA repair exonuclease SbcCD ATPase subunit|nr:SMC family ATPase [bacterium]